MTIQETWLLQGFFTLDSRAVRQTVTQSIRDELATLVDHPLRIKRYPVGPRRSHTFMWRTGTRDYAEAQLFMRIAPEYPVLSLGLYVEKGYEDSSGLTTRQRKTQLMDRRIWDWPRFVRQARTVVTKEIPGCAAALGRAVCLRISTRAKNPAGVRLREPDATFVLLGSDWFWRHRGPTTPAKIVEHVRALDAEKSLWVNVHLACDLFPGEAGGLTASDVRRLLLPFEKIRRRLRP